MESVRDPRKTKWGPVPCQTTAVDKNRTAFNQKFATLPANEGPLLKPSEGPDDQMAMNSLVDG